MPTKIRCRLFRVVLPLSLLGISALDINTSHADQAYTSTLLVAKQALPFPTFPSSLEESFYEGKIGCAQNEPRVLAAISHNEGTKSIGGIKVIETPRLNAHSLTVEYHPEKGYGYTVAWEGGKGVCIADKMKKITFKEAGDYTALDHSVEKAYSQAQCNFTARYGKICGSFKKITIGLSQNGFEIQFQGQTPEGNIRTLLSNDNKSYYLTTNGDTGATVVTGAGNHSFEFL